MSFFDRARLERRLFAQRRLAREIRVLESCRSSNEQARQLLEQGVELDGMLLVALFQSGGRGRRQRDWWSGPEGANVAVTLGLREERIPSEVFGLLGAVALADVIAALVGTPQRVALKWPNDILLDHEKLAGFLCEQPAVGQGTLLLGLGCNLTQAPPTSIAPYPTTCVAERLPAGTPCPSLEDFLALWLWSFELGMRRFLLAGPQDFESRFLAWLRHWAPHGVRDPRDGRAGPLLEFSVSRGLRWGPEPNPDFRPLGWIPTLEALLP